MQESLLFKKIKSGSLSIPKIKQNVQVYSNIFNTRG